MFKDSLFQKVRNEDVIIWAGAGLSISSGYPSGNKLKDIFYESLTPSEKSMVSIDMSLQDLTEAICTLKGNRHHVISTLNEVFGKYPTIPSDVHKKISLIPQLKTIITTNYDKLFELNCDNPYVVYNENQIPYLDDHKKTKIIKVHGDLASPDSIVITKSDYNKLFTANNLSNTLWNQVKAKLSTKTFLFLGYSADDSNFQVILDEISNSLGANRKEFFFIAPDVSELKKIELIKKNIHYINSTGENFIDDLISNIKENITDDLRKGKVSADTFRSFMAKHNLNPIISSENDSFKINDIECLSPTTIKSVFTINDKSAAKDLSDFIASGGSKDFVLKKSAMKDVNIWYGDIKLNLFSEIDNIKITNIPTKAGFIDIIFEDDFETNIYAELYRNISGAEIKLNLAAGDIKINVKFQEKGFLGKIDIDAHDICKDVDSCILFYEFLKRINLKMKFTVILENGEKYSQKLSSIDEINDFESYSNYFDRLKKVERFFKVKFKNFQNSEINDQSNGNLNKLISIINKAEFTANFTDDISILVKNPGSLKTNSQLEAVFKEQLIRITYKDEETISLHGVKFDLGLKHITINDAIYPNSEAVLGGDDNLIIKSKSKKAKINYIFDESA